MKRQSVFFHVLLIATLVTIAITGCGKDEKGPFDPGIDQGSDPSPSGIPSQLVGVWTFQSVTVNGYWSSLDDELDWVEDAAAAGFSLESDGTYTYLEVDEYGEIVWMEVGTAWVSSSSFGFSATNDLDGPINPPHVMTGTWSLSGNRLTLSVMDEGDRYIFTAVK